MSHEIKIHGSGPEEVPPPEGLEDRVVEALRSRGLLAFESKPRRRPWSTRSVAAVAAGLALFLGGLASGLLIEGGATARALASLESASTIDRAASVQRAGTEYVSALASIPAPFLVPDDPALRVAQEVGWVALQAAAAELARLSPEDPAIAQVLAVLDRSMPGYEPGNSVKNLVWY